jgi:hypothetical protein
MMTNDVAAKEDFVAEDGKHVHENVLCKFVSRDALVYGLKKGYLKKCECGNFLVKTEYWAMGSSVIGSPLTVFFGEGT